MKLKSVLVMLDPLSLPRLEAILAYARANGWAVILEDRLPEDGLARVSGALVSLRGKAEQLAKVKALRQCGKPVVDLTVACPKIKLPRVVSDHKALGALAARHFLGRGFTRFAWYASGSSPVHNLRRQGYADTLRQAGFTLSNLSNPNAANLSRCTFDKGVAAPSPPRIVAGKFRFVAAGAPPPLAITAIKLASCLSTPSHPGPLAVLAFDETDAAHVIAACQEAKLDVPGDVAVLGIGNDPFLCENGNVTISSVDQDLGHAAQEACALLDALMSGQHTTQRTITLVPPAGIIPRASTDTLAHPDPTIRAALIYIHRHLNKPFGAAETAEAIGIARSTLDHLFTEKLGHSIGTEILNQRLRRAKRLLKDRSVKLKDIALSCGFCNASYFTNVFRRETGMTPKAWRANT